MLNFIFFFEKNHFLFEISKKFIFDSKKLLNFKKSFKKWRLSNYLINYAQLIHGYRKNETSRILNKINRTINDKNHHFRSNNSKSIGLAAELIVYLRNIKEMTQFLQTNYKEQ